ncbi:MAG TPA: hypothetical protein VHY58_04520 [Streptosporangiaceae bacterium]|nr:hypothetical protein [Streptosporangiaceae bacterium]
MVSIKSHLVRTAAVGALGVAALAGFIAPASAAQAAPAAAHMSAAVAAKAKPNTNIQGTPAKWSPTKLTAAPTKGTCSGTNFSFSITNKTKKSQVIQEKVSGKKKSLGTLKASQKAGICLTGAKGAKGMLYIKGSTSVLTITLS